MAFTIGLTYDLRADYRKRGFTEEQVAEFDTDATIDAIDSTLQGLGYQTVRIGHAWALIERLVRGEKWDLVFNICEGVAGRNREAQVPAILDLYGIPCTFSDTLVCAVTLDKAVAKRLVFACGLATPAFHVVRTLADAAAVKLTFPLFAKPLAEGTGKGISPHSRITSMAELERVCRELLAQFKQPVLVEEYLPGREFTTGILGNGGGAAAIGTMEIIVADKGNTGIYSYENKELCDQFVRYARLEPGPLREAVQKLAVDCYNALECRDGARVDIRLDRDGRPSFMEVNPLAGLHPQHSDLPMIATQEGMSYPELLGAIVTNARQRVGI